MMIPDHLRKAVTIVALFMTALAATVIVVATSSNVPPTQLPACVTEDDPRDCYWDANTRGDGYGNSFVHYGGRYYYLDT